MPEKKGKEGNSAGADVTQLPSHLLITEKRWRETAK
jgi:hypothetical protein